MSGDVELSPGMLPPAHEGKWRCLRADLVKFGWVAPRTFDALPCVDGKGSFDAYVLPRLQAIHDALNTSPSGLDILTERPTNVAAGTSVSSLTSSVSTPAPFVILAKLPASEKAEVFYRDGDFPHVTFSILFDGTLFAAAGQIPRVPLRSSLGQNARNLLTKHLSVKFEQLTGPTPLQTNLYMLAVKAVDPGVPSDLPTVLVSRHDLLLLYDAETEFSDALLMVWPHARHVLAAFYDARFVAERVDDSIVTLDQMNKQLATLVAQYFELSWLRRTVGRLSPRIRKALATMHVAVQDLGAQRLELARWRSWSRDRVRESWLFAPVIADLDGEIEEHFPFDREAQLRFLDYAASETTNAATINATLTAGILGAIIGGVFVLCA